MLILAYSLIAILCGVEVYCGYALKHELKTRSEERTEARKAVYRARAYNDMETRWRLKKRRETLFRSITKE